MNRAAADAVRKAADAMPELVRNGTPVAVGVQGGVARGQVDDYSDIDLVLVFESQDAVGDAVRGHYTDGRGTEWGVRHLRLDQADPAHWSDARRYVYGYETQALRDPDSVLTDLRERALFTPREVRRRTAYTIRKLAQRGVIYPEAPGGEWRGLQLRLTDVDPWPARGDFYSAHMRLNQAHDLLVTLVYAVNGRPRASGKAVHSILRRLPWFPAELEAEFLGLARTGELDDAEYRRRLGNAKSCLVRCVDQGSENGCVGVNVGQDYYEGYESHSDDAECHHPAKPR